MALSAQLDTPTKFKVDYTLAGLPGSVDPSAPPAWTIAPDTNGTVVAATDGLTADITLTVLGDTAVSVKADANLATGVLDLVVSDTITVLEVANIGADAGQISPAV
jgi:hypothetical protein